MTGRHARRVPHDTAHANGVTGVGTVTVAIDLGAAGRCIHGRARPSRRAGDAKSWDAGAASTSRHAVSSGARGSMGPIVSGFASGAPDVWGQPRRQVHGEGSSIGVDQGARLTLV
jgi:hypothetical protein